MRAGADGIHLDASPDDERMAKSPARRARRALGYSDVHRQTHWLVEGSRSTQVYKAERRFGAARGGGALASA